MLTQKTVNYKKKCNVEIENKTGPELYSLTS